MSTPSLPPNVHTFVISVIGEETKKPYDGTFEYKRPTLGTKTAIGRLRCQLNGDLKNLDAGTERFNDIYATLFHCLVQSPDWWAQSGFGRDLYDQNVVEAIYLECVKYENDFYQKVYGEKVTEKEVVDDTKKV